MKKRTIILLAIIALLAVSTAFPFLKTAYQMKTYLRSVHPRFAPYAKLFSIYNPVDGAFNMRITDDSSASIFLECVSDGKIIDEMRANEYLDTHNIPSRYEDDSSTGTLLCYWKYNTPEEPIFNLTIFIHRGISIESDTQLEEFLKTKMLAHYEQLPDIAKDRLFRCQSAYQTAGIMYRLDIYLTPEDDIALLLNQAEMTKEEL